MMWLRWIAPVGLGLWMAACASAPGGARIRKVLPHYVDIEGRHTLSPSLYERDAYQAFLRKHPEARGGMQFDIRWNAPAKGAGLQLRIELRGNEAAAEPLVVERTVTPPRWGGGWSSVRLSPEELAPVGEVSAWRVTLLRDGEVLAEQRSFLW